MKAFLISGANGILAHEIVRQSLEKEPDTRIVALSGSCEALKRQYGGIPQISVLGWDALECFPPDGITAIIHCAFTRTETGPELLRSLECTKALLEKAAAGRVPFINISSRSVYGQNPALPWTEETVPAPNGLYALAKAAQELLVEQAGTAGGFPYTNLRLAGLMGVGMDARLVSKLVLQAVQTGELRLIGGAQQFALLDIRDAAAGVLALAGVPAGQWDVRYNLGHTEKVTLEEMAERIQKVAMQRYRQRVTINRQKKELTLLDGMDCSRFYRATGWRPEYRLEDTIQEIFENYRGEQS